MYKTKVGLLTGTDFREVRRKVLCICAKIRGRSKRKAYIRSAYFRKDKVFLALFWQHLFDKEKWRDRMRRLRYFAAAIDLIQHSRLAPISKDNPNKFDETLHRFTGENKKTFR